MSLVAVMHKGFLVVFDGPSSSGKKTLSKLVGGSSSSINSLNEANESLGHERVLVVQLHRSGTCFEGGRAYLNRQCFPNETFIQQQNDRPAKDVAADLLEILECVIADKRKSVNT